MSGADLVLFLDSFLGGLFIHEASDLGGISTQKKNLLLLILDRRLVHISRRIELKAVIWAEGLSQCRFIAVTIGGGMNNNRGNKLHGLQSLGNGLNESLDLLAAERRDRNRQQKPNRSPCTTPGLLEAPLSRSQKFFKTGSYF